jgi:hypothetical protein
MMRNTPKTLDTHTITNPVLGESTLQLLKWRGTLYVRLTEKGVVTYFGLLSGIKRVYTAWEAQWIREWNAEEESWSRQSNSF